MFNDDQTNCHGMNVNFENRFPMHRLRKCTRLRLFVSFESIYNVEMKHPFECTSWTLQLQSLNKSSVLKLRRPRLSRKWIIFTSWQCFEMQENALYCGIEMYHHCNTHFKWFKLCRIWWHQNDEHIHFSLLAESEHVEWKQHTLTRGAKNKCGKKNVIFASANSKWEGKCCSARKNGEKMHFIHIGIG